MKHHYQLREGIVLCITKYIFTPYQAGFYSGKPEDCFPDEPAEVEIIEAHLEDDYGHKLYNDWEDIADEYENMWYDEFIADLEEGDE